MALFALAVLLLAFTGSSSATWCVCKEGSDAILQKTLDYACGAGADCNPLHQNGPCFQPNTVRAHCNYAVNSYFQRKGQAQGSCDFAGTATVTASDPSTGGCSYPASARKILMLPKGSGTSLRGGKSTALQALPQPVAPPLPFHTVPPLEYWEGLAVVWALLELAPIQMIAMVDLDLWTLVSSSCPSFQPW